MTRRRNEQAAGKEQLIQATIHEMRTGECKTANQVATTLKISSKTVSRHLKESKSRDVTMKSTISGSFDYEFHMSSVAQLHSLFGKFI